MHITNKSIAFRQQEGTKMADRDDLLYPRHRYYGRFTPENVAFNANLQEFAQKVSLISCLATGGKLPLEQAFGDIEKLWEKLSLSKEQLGIDA